MQYCKCSWKPGPQIGSIANLLFGVIAYSLCKNMNEAFLSRNAETGAPSFSDGWCKLPREQILFTNWKL